MDVEEAKRHFELMLDAIDCRESHYITSGTIRDTCDFGYSLCDEVEKLKELIREATTFMGKAPPSWVEKALAELEEDGTTSSR